MYASTQGNQKILLPAVQGNEVFHFCMCNPPFFSTIEESAQNPHTSYGGTQAEMVYPGGDSAFVLQMVDDSTTLQGTIHWYTALLGKKASLKEVWWLMLPFTYMGRFSCESLPYKQYKTHLKGIKLRVRPPNCLYLCVVCR